MDGTQVGVLKETDEVGLAGFLKGHDSGGLEAQVGLEVLSDLANQTLEGQFADQQFGALLVATDLAESYSTGPVAVRFLDAPSGWGALPRGLGGQLFTRSLSSGRFASSLLGTSHFNETRET